MNALSDDEISALEEALDDEYKSFSTYDQVIVDFGDVRPFINIRDSEARHIAALSDLFTRYGLDIPKNPWLDRVPRFDSVKSACEAGVADEIANGEMYERLLSATHRSDIIRVFQRLQEASQQRHLNAFRRGAERWRAGTAPV